jgi:hypothetical protein
VIVSGKAKLGENPANAMANQGKVTFLVRLLEMGWPYYLMPEQWRIEPGLWYLAKHISYRSEEVVMGPGRTPSPGAKAFEKWAMR